MRAIADLRADVKSAVTSTRKVCELVSTICESPMVVENAAQSLQHALETLDNIKITGDLPEHLQVALNGYISRLSFFAKMATVSINRKDSVIQEGWNRYKPFLEQDLQEVHQAAHDFTTAFLGYKPAAEL